MRKKGNQILDYFGETRSGHIHAHGKVASTKIITLLDCKPNEKILEVGCGTGATLVQLASKYKNTHFYGVDASKIMCQSATKRLKFCGLLQNTQLTFLEKKLEFPFLDNAYDKVYVESVLAIQEGDDLKKLLIEIQRVLKPEGVLIFNETIWLTSTNLETLTNINIACKLSFGIIQANSEYPYLEDWKKIMLEIGLDFSSEIRISEILKNKKNTLEPVQVYLSEIYSLLGKLKSKITPRLRKQWNSHKKEMAEILHQDNALMEGVIIKSYNKKHLQGK